jgi:Sulfotransferase domain
MRTPSLGASSNLTCPSFVPELTTERRFLAPIRRRLKSLMLTAIDAGWFGLTPLQTHVVVCGFPRSGSTLLQLIAETCVTGLKGFGQEAPAVSMALWALRNHSVMLTKDPFDLFRVDEIRAFYAAKATKLRLVLTQRDARAILVSTHSRRPGGYYLTCEEWRAYYEHFRHARRGDDAAVVKYEDLVQRPAAVERQLQTFIGWTIHHPFDRFYEAVPTGFDAAALNGVRPLDPAAIDQWRQPRHHERIQRILQELPELPHVLIEMGYEPDTRWVQNYS